MEGLVLPDVVAEVGGEDGVEEVEMEGAEGGGGLRWRGVRLEVRVDGVKDAALGDSRDPASSFHGVLSRSLAKVLGFWRS